MTQDTDRRATLRIEVPFHARVAGADRTGRHFSIETVLDNICRDGLYLRLMPEVELGTQLSIEVGLYTTLPPTEAPSHLSINGVVLRKEKKAGGAAGVAVSFAKVSFH